MDSDHWIEKPPLPDHRMSCSPTPPPSFRFSQPSVYDDTLQGKTTKLPSESPISASPKRHQMLCSVPECSTAKQAGQGRVQNWAYVNFSCLRFQETNKFVFELRDTCVAIGMEFENLDPTVNLHIDNPIPSVMESTFSYLHGLIKDEAFKKPMGLLIVILPDFRTSDAEVEERCKDLGVPYRTFSPEKATTSDKEYLNREAREINSKVLLWFEIFNFLMNMEECDQSTEQMGADCISMELGDKIRKDGDSNKLCSSHKESQDSDSSESSDKDMGEFGDSFGVLDEEMGEHSDYIIGNNPDVDSESSDFEYDESDFTEDECVLSKTEDSEESYSDDEMRDDGGTEERENNIMSAGSTDILPPFTVVDQVASEKFLSYEKQPWLMGVRSTKRDYLAYGNLKIHRGVVVDWACVNFSLLGDRQLHRFYRKLFCACHSIRMSFDSTPMETFHEKSADPDIENTFLNVFENLSKQFAALGMAGETIGFMLIILPEARALDAKIKWVCDNRGVLYHCLFPSDIYSRDEASMNELACQIKSKVVERDTFIPFVSEGPTFIFGADTSCNDVASVVAPVKWQEFRNYVALFGPNKGAEIQNLFDENGGMIGYLLSPFRKKIEKGCRIIFFRHGVIEDLIDNIYHQEVEAIKLACGKLEIGCKPSVTFVVVGGNKEESSNDGKHDFVCHHGFVKGTSPARYRVLLDENNLTFAEVESIIIKLCLLRDHVAFPQIYMVPPAYASLESSLAETEELPRSIW